MLGLCGKKGRESHMVRQVLDIGEGKRGRGRKDDYEGPTTADLVDGLMKRWPQKEVPIATLACPCMSID